MSSRLHRRVGIVRTVMFSLAAFLPAIPLTACGPDEEPTTGGGSGGSSFVACDDLTVQAGSAANDVAFWPDGDTYGVNSFYVWELDAAASVASGYVFHTNGSPVTGSLPAKNWRIPPTYWSTIRLALDGYDPYKFSDSDPFYLWYLPYVPGQSWLSKTGATNDGTCPGGAATANGRVRCKGKNQVDPNAPSLLAGKAYLVRMLMLIPLGGQENRVQSCFQTLLIR